MKRANMDNTTSYRKRFANHFLSGKKRKDRWRIGIEVEHLCVRKSDGVRIPYAGGKRTVKSILKRLLSRRGGQPIREAGNQIGIEADSGNVTLEPGGQIEWSSPPSKSLTELSKQLDCWLKDFRSVLEELDITTLNSGLDRHTQVREIPWVPKERYRMMRSRYKSNPKISSAAMGNTTGIHVTLDYRNERDWQKKFRAMLLLTPVASAIFANAPFQCGETKFETYRPMLWTTLDRERCLPPAIAFNPVFGIDDWAGWVANVSELFACENGRIRVGSGQPFSYSAGRQRKDHDSMMLHLSSLFTPVRTNQCLETRCVDMQSDNEIMSVPAFWTGCLYSERSIDQILTLLSFIDSRAKWLQLYSLACRFGITHPLVRTLSQQVLNIALAGLDDWNPEADEGRKLLKRKKSTLDVAGRLPVEMFAISDSAFFTELPAANASFSFN